jgi:hypothetical protein
VEDVKLAAVKKKQVNLILDSLAPQKGVMGSWWNSGRWKREYATTVSLR